MKLENLRWYDWLFFYFAGLWLVFAVDVFARIGMATIFVYALFPFGYSLIAAVPYFPIYIAYKVYKWKKKKKKA